MTNEEIALKIVERDFAKVDGEYLVFETLNNTSRVEIKNLKDEVSARASLDSDLYSLESEEDHLFWKYVEEWIEELEELDLSNY